MPRWEVRAFMERRVIVRQMTHADDPPVPLQVVFVTTREYPIAITIVHD